MRVCEVSEYGSERGVCVQALTRWEMRNEMESVCGYKCRMCVSKNLKVKESEHVLSY